MVPEGGLFVMVDVRDLGRPSDEVRAVPAPRSGRGGDPWLGVRAGGRGDLRVSFAAGGETLERGLDRLREGLLRLASEDPGSSRPRYGGQADELSRIARDRPAPQADVDPPELSQALAAAISTHDVRCDRLNRGALCDRCQRLPDRAADGRLPGERPTSRPWCGSARGSGCRSPRAAAARLRPGSRSARE